MKLNIKGLVFVGFAAAVFASAANAEDKIVTSKTYVDAKYDGVGAVTVRDGTQAEGKLNKRVITVADYQGATEQNAGVPGLVPSATTAQRDYVLKGDGTWAEVDGTEYSSGNAATITVNNHQITAVTAPVAAGSNALVTGDAVASYVKDGQLSIQVGNNQAQTFTANQATGTTVQLGSAAAADTTTTIAEDGTGLPTAGAVYNYLTTNYDTAGEQNVQANWTETDTQSDAYILNKPTLGTAAAANTTTTIAEDGTGLPTAGAVYNFLTTGMTPTGTTCSDAAPCALVLGSGAPTWQPIQQ